MNLPDLSQGAHARHLRILGHFAPEDSHSLGPEVKTVVLLGPDEPQFWSAFEDSSEYRDGAPGIWEAPLDRLPYLVPQEYGLRTDTRWVELIDSHRGPVQTTSRGFDRSRFKRSEVVTREDYDKQIEKLSKAEAKLAELETRLAALEK